MGVALKEHSNAKEISLNELHGKVVVIDAYNMLYQFLTTIRSRDGSLLTTSSGKVTSHLLGLFSRVTNFLEKEIHLVFVFDGDAPQLKKAERARRQALKEEAQAKYKIAVEKEDESDMKKYASRTTHLNKEMIEDAKTLLQLLGVPIIQAPAEGEAQAAFMCKRGDAYAVISQDFDSLLFGSPLLIRNLSLVGRRKRVHGVGTVTIKPEIISLSDIFNNLGIDREGLIALGMLIGTDFNYGGIKGIGPKKAVKLVKEYAGRYDELFEYVEWDKQFEVPWTEVFYLFKKMPVTEEYDIKKSPIKKEELTSFLVEECEFDKERVILGIKKLQGSGQKGLGDFFS